MDEANQSKYPQRLFQDGKYPTLPRSLNHGSSLEQLRGAKKLLGDAAWKDMIESSLGCVAKLAEKKFIFCGNTLFYFLTRQLDTKKQMKMWSLIGDDPLRFSLYEFAKITGLDCDQYAEDVGVDIDHTELWAKMGLAVGDGPHWTDMLRVLKICGGWTPTEKMSVGFLCLLHVGVFGFQRGSRIELKYAKKALDKKVFNSFQWGRLAFDVLISSIRKANLAASSVTLDGFVYAVNVWAYESYPKLGEMHGGRKSDDALPILRWGGSLAHYDVDDVIFAAKSEEYEVRNMVMKAKEDIYPDWGDEPDDERVDTLLEDIINQRLQKKEWTWEWHGRVLDGKKLKGPGNKKCASSEQNSKGETAGPSSKKNKTVKVKGGCEHTGETSSNAEVVNLLKSVFEKLGEMDSHNRQQFSAIGTRFFEVEDQMGLMKGAIRSLQNDAKAEGKKPVIQEEVVEDTSHSQNVKQAGVEVNGDNVVENSTPDTPVPTDLNGEKDRKDSASENLSWLERPSHVEKKPKAKKAKKKAVGKKTENSEKLVKVKVEPAEKFVTPKNKGKRKTKGAKLVVEDVGDEDSTEFGKHLDKLAAQLRKDNGDVAEGRIKLLAKSQLEPYVPSSVVKRIMSTKAAFGKFPSDYAYDPFEKVEERKLQNLRDFIQQDEEEPISTFNPEVNFYKRLMTKKEDWTEAEYGWLGDQHITGAMRMFRKRLLLEENPYRTDRVAFIDQMFINFWYQETKEFEKKKAKFIFKSGY